jgi:hypothetical protein
VSFLTEPTVLDLLRLGGICVVCGGGTRFICAAAKMDSNGARVLTAGGVCWC